MADYEGTWDIWTMPATGGAPTQITNAPGMENAPCWSPDGLYIAFKCRPPDTTSDICVVPAAGGDIIQLTDHPNGDWGPSWSPDGTQIAFFSIRSGNYDIYVIDVHEAGIEPEENGTSWGSITRRFESK